MTTKEFLKVLKDNPTKQLVFEYKPKSLVGANYHITEVKNISVEAVDCGGRADAWEETVIQLWESPSEIGKTTYMSASKASQILNRVHRMRAMNMDSILKFEYGNTNFHTAQLPVNSFKLEEDRLLISLTTDQTDCKAKTECGLPEEVLSQESIVCTPDSGCC